MLVWHGQQRYLKVRHEGCPEEILENLSDFVRRREQLNPPQPMVGPEGPAHGDAWCATAPGGAAPAFAAGAYGAMTA
jgi:hypothetical protein